MENHTAGTIRDFLRRRFPLVRERGLSDTDPLLESGAIDSLGVLDIVTFLEKEFGIRVEDGELDPENFESVASLTRLVARKRAGTTLVIVTHNIPSARVLSDRMAFLHEGRIIASGTAADLDAAGDPLVQAFMQSEGGG